MLRYCFATLLAVFYCIYADAQDSCALSVQVLVTELHNAVPLPGVFLHLSESKMNVQTDDNGIATLEHLCPGTYSVHLHSYETEDTTLLLTISKSGLYRIQLMHSDKVLHQIVVKSSHESTLLQSNDRLDSKMMHENTGKTISEMLKNVNGVSTLNNGATISKPVIHGLHSNRILVLNNGIRQEDQQWGSEHAPNIDPFVASNITVLKGAAGVRYGTDAMGGVLLAEPSPVRSDPGWGGELNLAGFSNNRMGIASLMAEHRVAKHPEFSFRVQASAKQGGNYSIPGNIRVANSGVMERNFSAIVNYRGVHSGAELFFSHFGNTLGVYSGSHTGTQQDLERAMNSPVPLIPATFTYDIGRPRQQVNHELAKIRIYHENKWGVWNFVYAFQHNFRREYDVVRIDKGQPQLNLKLNTQSINLNLDHKKLWGFSGQAGVDAQYQHNTFKDGDRVFIPSYYSFGAALYLIERLVHKAWTFEWGGRYDYKHFDLYNPEGVRLQNVRYLFDYSNPAATAAVQYKPSLRWTWNATLANAWRAPQAPELFSAGLHQGGARIELGNKNLVPEKSYNLNLSGTYELEHKLKFDVSVYGQSIRDFIYLRPGAEVLTIRGYYKTFSYVQTDALLYGTDISAVCNWNKHLSTDIKAAMLRARDQVRKGWLILMPSDRFSSGTRYAFDISEGVKECYLGLSADYVLRQTRLPADFDEIDAQRPPAAYFLLQAEAGLQFACRKQAVECSITASNLLNSKYRDYMDIFRYFIDQPGTNVALRLRVPLN